MTNFLFSGDKCEKDKIDCAIGICDLAGSDPINPCTEGQESYTCNCKSEYTGQHCEVRLYDHVCKLGFTFM